MGRIDAAAHRLAGVHVLIVDDHDDSRDLWEKVLQYAGALVTAARSAPQALALCNTVRPDVVVTDLSMPEHDGVWLAEQLRARGEQMPLVAVSGYTAVFGDRLRTAPFSRILQKPLDPWILVEAVVSLVG
jgi:CheY-like chemotaxis protein